MFLLEESDILMQLSYFIVLELVRCGKLIDLLVEECDIGLVLGVQSLSLSSHVGERLLEVQDLVAVCLTLRGLVLL